MPGRTLTGQTVYGNACSLNGTTQYFGRAIVSTVSDNLTIAAWVKLTANTASNQAIYQNGENDGNGYVLLVRGSGSSNKLRIDLSFVAGLDSSTSITAGSWYHVAATRNAGTWQLYINGAADGGTIGNAPNGPAGNTTVGASRSSGGTASSFLGGLIDEVRFYSRALSASEITALYNQAAAPSTIVSSASLQGQWKFDETSGNAADSSGNSRTLTNNNTATYTTGIAAISAVPARTAAGTRIGQLAAGKTEALVDQLNDNSTDTNKWTAFSSSATVAEANNRLEITLPNSIAGTNYAGYTAVSGLSLISSYVRARISQAPNIANGSTILKAQNSGGTNYVQIQQYNGTLKFQYNSGGGDVDVATKSYDSSADLWWRIRESGGTTYFDTSADNVMWYNRASVANPITMTNLFGVMTAGTFGSQAAPPKAYFDNYNLPFAPRTLAS